MSGVSSRPFREEGRRTSRKDPHGSIYGSEGGAVPRISAS